MAISNTAEATIRVGFDDKFTEKGKKAFLRFEREIHSIINRMTDNAIAEFSRLERAKNKAFEMNDNSLEKNSFTLLEGLASANTALATISFRQLPGSSA